MRHSRATDALLTSTVTITALLGLSACGGGGGTTATDDGAAADPPAGPSAGRSSARAVVKNALRTVVAAGSATFDSHVELGSITYDDVGEFQLEPAAQQFTRTADLGGGRTYRIEARGVDGEFYVQQPADDDQPAACWLGGDPARLTAATGASIGDGPGSLPAVAYAVASAKGKRFADSTGAVVGGTVDLARAAAVVSGQLPQQLGIAVGDHRVAAEFTVTDDTLSGLRVDGDALNDAAAAAGVDGADSFPDGASIDVTIADVGADIDVTAPEADTVIDVGGDPAKTQGELVACNGG